MFLVFTSACAIAIGALGLVASCSDSVTLGTWYFVAMLLLSGGSVWGVAFLAVSCCPTHDHEHMSNATQMAVCPRTFSTGCWEATFTPGDGSASVALLVTVSLVLSPWLGMALSKSMLRMTTIVAEAELALNCVTLFSALACLTLSIALCAGAGAPLLTAGLALTGWLCALLLVSCFGLHAGDSCLCCTNPRCYSQHRARKQSVRLGVIIAAGLGFAAWFCFQRADMVTALAQRSISDKQLQRLLDNIRDVYCTSADDDALAANNSSSTGVAANDTSFTAIATAGAADDDSYAVVESELALEGGSSWLEEEKQNVSRTESGWAWLCLEGADAATTNTYLVAQITPLVVRAGVYASGLCVVLVAIRWTATWDDLERALDCAVILLFAVDGAQPARGERR